MMNIQKTTLAVLAGLMVSGSGWAANEGKGTFGTTSSANLEIKMKVPKHTDGDGGGVLIQGLDNIDLGAFNSNLFTGSGDSDFCIYATGAGKEAFDIDLTITGDAKDGFVLVGNDTNQTKISYDVHYAAGVDSASASSAKAESGKVDHTFADVIPVALDETFNCAAVTTGGATENASLYIAVDKTEVSTAPAASYSGTLTLLAAAK